jgi:hypothetical protein
MVYIVAEETFDQPSVPCASTPSAAPRCVSHDRPRESRITECAAYVRVDFGSSDCSELFETYRSFAELCNGRQVNGALLMAGDNAPEGHRELHEALSSMARTIARPARVQARDGRQHAGGESGLSRGAAGIADDRPQSRGSSTRCTTRWNGWRGARRPDRRRHEGLSPS